MLDVSSSSHEVTGGGELYKGKSTLTTESTYVIPMTLSLLGVLANHGSKVSHLSYTVYSYGVNICGFRFWVDFYLSCEYQARSVYISNLSIKYRPHNGQPTPGHMKN